MERDFTKASVNKFRLFGGANGSKIGIHYEGENYMLKFPPKPSKNPMMSYTNSCISEYVACHIFESLGIKAQKTLLGKYGDKITVACRDFCQDGLELKEFAQLKNSMIDSEQNGYGTELPDIIQAIEIQQLVPPQELEDFFWEMFIGDAFLGNFDRHNGNWGFLINAGRGEVQIAPVFDCGSCLYPQITEQEMKKVMADEQEIEKRIYMYPNSAIQENGKKINYYNFLTTTKNDSCLRALRKIGSRINMKRVADIIDNTPYISENYKSFLKTMIEARKERIIDAALIRLPERQVQAPHPQKARPNIIKRRHMEMEL